jgi:hypothetical protein
MGVYCHNDVNDSGKNIIHRIEEFEKHCWSSNGKRKNDG